MSSTSQNKAIRFLNVFIVATLPLTAALFLLSENQAHFQIGTLRVFPIDLLALSMAASTALIVWQVITAFHLRNRH